MAYANSVVFYGWLGNDAIQTVSYILNDKKISSKKYLLDNKDKLQDQLNKKLMSTKIRLTIAEFEGGLFSNKNEVFLHFDKSISTTSSDDDDICYCFYTLENLKNLMDMSFKIKDITDPKIKPKLINLVVSDTK
ncbi:hypothetical protein Catovirus_1_317 [Catovirus CTV1]|uniref:Uncharacterized protein n=1 Tax=Catovirus CTV1 TaxID=1977631 RepID=A0A1V0S982_9VIRU|nr:hypothetical protein Catovirus_1_317 [Catovirus CTV1]